ncbi:MAG: single-stranded-DNA-specific exonuclease RecJ [Candidatus Aegiribacteria sp.]|nr:single-stranded-DNA-specific exonuclease RecJ [Candidatus Aegiribacteria sp.]
MRKRWVARPAPELNLKVAENPCDLPESISLLLARRGFTDDKLNIFLNPDMENLSDWKDMGGILKAAQRIVSAVKNSERILIHGDFDADGITATAIVYMGLQPLGAHVDYFIPDRFEDGYGLGESSIEACSAVKAGLLITVDCGITAAGYIKILKDMDVDTVITDHHQPDEILPDAEAIVNPVLDEDAPYSKLAGAGVAWMVLRAVYDLLSADTGHLFELLQFVAIGTVTDVVDLTGDNRILVAEGLKQLRRSPLPGISALTGSASLDIDEMSSTDIAFYIGPLLNACGRVGHAADAVKLLLAGSTEEAEELIEIVEEYNRVRRKLNRKIENHVIRLVEKLDTPRCIVMADEGWHRGVIGIVASRLVSKYGVPSIMISIENDIGYGSARSVPGIPIYSILTGLQAEHRIMESLGGHPMAAGFRIPEANIPILREELNSILSGDEWDGHLGSVLYIDGKLEEQDYNAETVKALKMIEPFGEGNRKPVWIARGAYPVQWRAVGKNADHLSCNFRIGSVIYRAIGFNMVNRQSMFDSTVDLAFTLALDTYRGDGSIQLVLKDIRRHRRVVN